MTRFTLETLVDFPDDAMCVTEPITVGQIDALMSELARRGVRRVHWAYYGDGHGGFVMPAGIEHLPGPAPLDYDQNQWSACAATYRLLGNPLRVAAEAAHRHGLELFAYFKPYETGPAVLLPDGSPQAKRWGTIGQIGGKMCWLDPFVVANPHLRLKRRADDLDRTLITAPIASIVLTKRDDAPTRLTRDHLQIWVSDANYRYRRLDAAFELRETIEKAARQRRDVYGNVVTEKGAPVRVLRITGLNITAPFVLVTTDFTAGPGDFANTSDQLMKPLDGRGREIPCVFATGTAVWFPQWEDFRTGGLNFDTGRGPEVVTLDLPNHRPPSPADMPASQRHHLSPKPVGYLAAARGRNEYLPGALCETEPAVQDFWLSCVGEMLEAGVDGVDFRVENHSTHTDTPEDYGFNQVVLDRGGDVSAVRGQAYTDFLRRAAGLIRSRGKVMRANLNVDWFRPAHERPGSRRLAFPANIDFDWRRWLDEGLLDQATLRPFAKPFDSIFADDATAQEMIGACRRRGVPLFVNRYVWGNEKLVDELERVRGDGRFAGLVLYEAWSFTRIAAGRWGLADSPTGPGTDSDAVAHRERYRTSQRVAEALGRCAATSTLAP